jgi:hypothetical protein
VPAATPDEDPVATAEAGVCTDVGIDLVRPQQHDVGGQHEGGVGRDGHVSS